MVADLLHPLNIFILGLGGGFLIPLLNRLGRAVGDRHLADDLDRGTRLEVFARTADRQVVMPVAVEVAHGERLAQLQGMRAGSPREAYEGALAIARERLTLRDWRKLEGALAEVPVAA